MKCCFACALRWFAGFFQHRLNIVCGRCFQWSESWNTKWKRLSFGHGEWCISFVENRCTSCGWHGRVHFVHVWIWEWWTCASFFFSRRRWLKWENQLFQIRLYRCWLLGKWSFWFFSAVIDLTSVEIIDSTHKKIQINTDVIYGLTYSQFWSRHRSNTVGSK